MPDLSSLHPKLILLHSLNRILGGGPRDQKTAELVMNFVRLVDKTVTSYGSARQDLEAFRQDRQSLSSLMSATSHLETCLSAYARAVRLVNGLAKVAPSSIPTSAGVPRYDKGKPYVALRNSIQHLDERIEKGRIDSVESPLCLVLANDRIRLAGLEYPYAEFANRIREQHALAGSIAHYPDQPPVTSKSDGPPATSPT
jgi:hypothetical protein